MSHKQTIQQEDLLQEVQDIIEAPSKNTKRKILFSINVTAIISLVALIRYFFVALGGLPAPERDVPFYTALLIILGFSALHNGALLFFIKRRTNITRILDDITAWSTYVIFQLLAIVIVITNTNTATSILVDFGFSLVVIFVAGTILNRWMGVVSFVIACLTLYLAFQARGTGFEYHLLAPNEVKVYLDVFGVETFNELKVILKNETQAAELLARVQAENPAISSIFEERQTSNLEPLPIGLFVSVWFTFLVFAGSAIFFETSMLGQILRVIPTAISKINKAAEQKQTLESENARMGTELDVAKDIQTMVLPKEIELQSCQGLDVAARMDTASEVGGDFYEVLPQKDGSTFFGIGDVTDHGLQSGIVMLMTQTAYRTALASSLNKKKKVNLKDTLAFINHVVYENVQTRLEDVRNLTLSLIEYRKGKVSVTGQHETFLLKKKDKKKIENISTSNLGLYIGMTDDITPFAGLKNVTFNTGDTLLFYTDGVTEAENKQGEQYEMDRLLNIFDKNSKLNAKDMIAAIYKDVYTFIDGNDVLDDITMLIVKRMS